jgi:3-oxoacyl-[acyl-carrier protein] reductase/meso-butanediol dehydrogenase/(S,S)-butanediol dehydrogenase/diacetyl reductase
MLASSNSRVALGSEPVFAHLLIDAGRGGSIVKISSIAGMRMSPGTAAYTASRAGLQALTACMARGGR